MATFMHYSATEGGHIAASKVTVRKFPADLSKTREYRLSPVSVDGSKAVKVERRLLSPSQLAAWREATDALRALPVDAGAKAVREARAAVAATLAGIDTLTTESAISPTRAQMDGIRALTDAATLAADLAAGVVVIPSTRADDGAASKAGKAKMTEAERTADAIAAMFAPVEATEASEPSTDGASGDEPSEPVRGEPDLTVAVDSETGAPLA